MAAFVQLRPYDRDLGMVMREVDENLAIFLGLRNGEKGKNDLPLIEDSLEFDISKERESISSLMAKASPETIHQNVADDDFLDLEIDMSDYDWLVGYRESNGEVDSPKRELADDTTEESVLTTKTSSADAKRRPSSSGERKPTPGAATPTERRPMISKPSHPALAASKTTLTSSTKPRTRSSTQSKPTNTAGSKSGSRSSTPTRKPAHPSTKSRASDSDRSSSGRKPGSTVLKNPSPSRRGSQTVKLMSHDATEIPKTSLPERPASASRGRRPNAPATRLASSNGKPRQKSCSPARTRAPNGNAVKNGNVIMVSSGRGYSDDDDDVNPVLMGTKMVERVVNMRKLAPPKHDDRVPTDKSTRKSSLENSGFGRSLSKKSLDMAIRHMDIRRSIPDSLCRIATVVSSSDRGIQYSSSKSGRGGGSESTLTSSSDSSKSSNGGNSYFSKGDG